MRHQTLAVCRTEIVVLVWLDISELAYHFGESLLEIVSKIDVRLGHMADLVVSYVSMFRLGCSIEINKRPVLLMHNDSGYASTAVTHS